MSNPHAARLQELIHRYDKVLAAATPKNTGPARLLEGVPC
jgi:hypothetical protein